jgi:hypothetical protein
VGFQSRKDNTFIVDRRAMHTVNALAVGVLACADMIKLTHSVQSAPLYQGKDQTLRVSWKALMELVDESRKFVFMTVA